MKELIITKNQVDQRLDRILRKFLSGASEGFLYKALRKKSITLNGKKADGSKRLKEGDVIRVWFSDETVAKLTLDATLPQEKPGKSAKNAFDQIEVLYADEDVLIFVKPAGMLSQKAVPSDVSANDFVLNYSVEHDLIKGDGTDLFRPSVVNRLDRNTSGVMAAGLSLTGSRVLSELFRDRSLTKWYSAIVLGKIDRKLELTGYLSKDEKTNKVRVFSTPGENRSLIRTDVLPVRYDEKTGLSLVKVHLLTGKSHQIRAHLASIGHPILGDPKYGDENKNRQFGARCQYLHAFELTFPACDLPSISGRQFFAKVPSDWPMRPDQNSETGEQS